MSQKSSKPLDMLKKFHSDDLMFSGSAGSLAVLILWQNNTLPSAAQDPFEMCSVNSFQLSLQGISPQEGEERCSEPRKPP